MNLTHEEFFEIIIPGKLGTDLLKMGTIPASYVSGRPTVKFDGETAAGTRTYTYLSSYTPVANDRVLVAIVGRGMVVLGKIL